MEFNFGFSTNLRLLFVFKLVKKPNTFDNNFVNTFLPHRSTNVLKHNRGRHRLEQFLALLAGSMQHHLTLQSQFFFYCLFFYFIKLTWYFFVFLDTFPPHTIHVQSATTKKKHCESPTIQSIDETDMHNNAPKIHDLSGTHSFFLSLFAHRS